MNMAIGFNFLKIHSFKHGVAHLSEFEVSLVSIVSS